MTIAVRLASSTDLESWNDFLFDQEGVPPYSDFRWKEVLETVYGVKPRFLIASGPSGSVEGILPVYINKSLRGRRRLYSLNRGLVASSVEAESALVDWIRQHWQELELSEAVISSRRKPQPEYGSCNSKSAIVLPLDTNPEETWKRLRAKTRNMIRRAEKTGLIAESGFANLRDFYKIYSDRMLSLGVPIYGFDLFQNIAKSFPDDSELIVARLGDEIISGIFLIYGKQTAAYPFQATKSRHLGTAATQFLIW